VTITRRRRDADSPLVAAITHVTYGAPAVGELQPDVTLPDGLWDIVVLRHRGAVDVLQTGLITKPVVLPYEPGDEYLAISFKPGAYMPRLPGARMVDRGVNRPIASDRRFELDADTFEIPTFENADGLVDRLVRRGIVVLDDVVGRVADGDPAWASERTIQRRFRWALGLSPKGFDQIRRAGDAVALLERGRAAADVAAELGYADQAHLTRSMRRFMGRTPGEIMTLSESFKPPRW
jgi:Helix-turn-helix domain